MPPKTKTDIKKAEQDRLQAMIIEMLREEENKYCADCDAKQPRWASWNLGVFLCIRCAGIHRNLGVHLTKVKSVNLDSWTAVQVQSMRVMGNAKGRAVYEHALPKDFRRAQNDHSLESFIRAKYEQKRYIMKDWLPPRVDVNDLSLELKSERETKKVAATPKIPNGCAPSPKVESHSSPVQQQTKEIQLLDFSDSITVPSVPPTSQSNTDLFFNELTPKNTNSVAVGDTLDDIFGPVVSAPPVSVEENSSISNGFGDFSAFASASTSETAANNGQTQSVPSVASAPSLFEDLNGLNMGPPAPSQSAILTSATLSATDNSKKSNLDILALFGSSSQSPSASVCSQLSSLSGLNMTAPAPAVGSQFVSAPAVQSSLGSNNLGQFGGFGFGASQSNGMSAETAAKFAAASPFANQAKGFGSTAPTSDLLGGLSTQSTTMASSSANNFDFDFGGLTFGGSSTKPATATKSLWD